MKKFFTNQLTSERSHAYILFVVSLFSILLALVPVFYTWGRLNVGGDVLVPLGSDGLKKDLYHWISINDGQYFSINYYPFYFLYTVFEICHLDIYQSASAMLFILGITAAFGVYKICSLFSDRESYYVYFAPILFYLFSPALLNGWHYNFIYAFSPWFIYFIFKIIKQRKIEIDDVVWINLAFFFCTLELPNPKYVFYLYLTALVIFLSSFFFKLIDISFLKKNWKKFVIHLLLSAYIFLPTAYFVTQYSAEKYGVQIKSGYQSTGPMMNRGTDTVDRVFKLHQDMVFLNYKDADRYSNNSLIIILSLSFIFIIAMVLLVARGKPRQKKEYQLIVLGLLLTFFFLAAGPNPPLGFIYEYMVTTFPLLAFLRTTGGAVFYLSLFYAISIFNFLTNLHRYKAIGTLMVLISISVVSYPFLNGEYYKNFNNINQYTNIEEYGYKIPDAYFRVKAKLDSLRIDAKVLYSNSDLTYLNTRWGFFGPTLYNFIYKTSNVGYNTVAGNPSLHNVGFIYHDGSLLGSVPNESIKSTLIAKDEFVEISRLSRKEFLPHFYIPTQLLLSDNSVETLAQLASSGSPTRAAVVSPLSLTTTNVSALNLAFTPSVEFRKIDATKYRVRIHGARSSFPLVFSENFHSGWEAYVGNTWNAEDRKSNSTDYKILDGNAEDQATIEELKTFLQSGSISTLGDRKEKIFNHKKWQDEKEVYNYSENYRIEFISKNFQDTIQNDNLAAGVFYETWLKRPLPETVHFNANGYANGWVIETEKICRSSPTVCAKSSNGTYDFELIVEFWPQKLYYLSILISLATLLSCLGYLLYRTIHKSQAHPVI